MLFLLQIGSILINLGTVYAYDYGFSAFEKQACLHLVCAAECDETGSQQAVCRSARKHKATYQVKGQSSKCAIKVACLQVSSFSCSITNCRKYREWQGGVGLFIVGNVLNFVSFGTLLRKSAKAQQVVNRIAQALTYNSDDAGFAAQSLLAALGSVQFVSNVFFAWFVLHERVCLTLRQYLQKGLFWHCQRYFYMLFY